MPSLVTYGAADTPAAMGHCAAVRPALSAAHLGNRILMLDQAAWTRPHLYAHPAAVALIAFGVAVIVHRWRNVRVSALSTALALLGVVSLVGSMIFYLALTAYSDHIEPSIASVAAAWLQGQPLYPGLDSSYQYGLPYGPWLYLLNAGGLSVLGGGIAQSKLLSILSAAASLVAISRLRPGQRTLTAGIAAIAYMCFGTMSYWVRPEPILLLATSCAALSCRQNVRPVTLGIAFGVAISVKISAVLYLSPFAVLFLLKARLSAALRATLTATCIVILPFVLPLNTSAAAYADVLMLTADHGIRLRSLLTQIEWAALLSVPVAIGLLRNDDRTMQVFRSVLLLSLALTIPLAAKQGAGPHHFLPFMPAIALALRGRVETDRLRGLALGSVVVSLTMIAASQQLYWYHVTVPSLRPEVAAEMSGLVAKHGPSLSVGYSSEYRLSDVRVLPVFAGGPYVLDAPALMDRQLAGRPFPAAVVSIIWRCEPQKWVLPKQGAPFELSSAYAPHEDIFSDSFRREFRARYVRVEETEHFSVWKCLN